MNLKGWNQQRYQKLKELTRKYLDTSAYFCLHGEQGRAAVLVLSFQAATRLSVLKARLKLLRNEVWLQSISTYFSWILTCQ